MKFALSSLILLVNFIEKMQLGVPIPARVCHYNIRFFTRYFFTRFDHFFYRVAKAVSKIVRCCFLRAV